MSRTYGHGSCRHSKSFQFERKYTTRQDRMYSRLHCNEALVDAESSVENIIEPRNHIWWKNYRGFWRPMNRWLNSHIGNKWNDVHSELIEKLKKFGFDNDIIRNNITYLVNLESGLFFNYYNDYSKSFSNHLKWRFYVDDQNILRKKRKLRSKKMNIRPAYDTNKISTWLDGRIVGKCGTNYYWFIPLTSFKKSKAIDEIKCEWANCKYFTWCTKQKSKLRYLVKSYALEEDNGEVAKENWIDVAPSEGDAINSRQGNKLTKKDTEFFNNLPKYYQNEILKWAPFKLIL